MRSRILVAVILSCCCGAAIAKEHPQAELFGGFSFQRFQGIQLYGWDSSILASINSWLALGADLSGSYNKFERVGVDVDANMLSAMFGPRLSLRKDRVTTFGRVLCGVTWAQAGAQWVPLVHFEPRTRLRVSGKAAREGNR